MFSRHKQNQKAVRGLTLVELIVAITLVPILIYAASIMYLNVSKTMETTAVRGDALTEHTLVKSTLERMIPNAQTADVDTSAYCTEQCGDGGGNCEWCYGLTLNLPDNSTQILGIRTDIGASSAVLEFKNEGDVHYTQVSYMGTITCGTPGSCDALEGSARPFDWDENNEEVSYNLAFDTGDGTRFMHSAGHIRLEGGTGV
ncbi:MAG: hypothetical protein COV74_08420 [Candidatus Omnitrophica bacterium CG11_big_fil_rev_8_21_14_0_20_45_26]|uniref:Prepilin-type N-terminal cleavage/methylation domain-containing protein n=1 Tax=Candidatus Abzuiibacterium crystallinum TaxID=1974748 RepID=A0A2H0LPS8_9BACT|nr:MAG: hypothetical protein COV74_08420 [Candidatus Omnitrophica bacterium CG11_big_fil_rev_8_21_14_0_20_45_26]PIW63685.1 MAG: hypothetical protein COW12_09305 [Candidatus Omnitrophica bacterium CG12_big_fil_rev_8_21_14_0_65_45_16]